MQKYINYSFNPDATNNKQYLLASLMFLCFASLLFSYPEFYIYILNSTKLSQLFLLEFLNTRLLDSETFIVHRCIKLDKLKADLPIHI